MGYCMCCLVSLVFSVDRMLNHERYSGCMQHTFGNAAKHPALHASTTMGCHNNQVMTGKFSTLSLLRCLDNGLRHIHIDRNGGCDRKVVLREVAFRKAFGNGFQVRLVLMFRLCSYSGFEVLINRA